MRRSPGATIGLAILLAIAGVAGPAWPAPRHSLAERVADGPAAALIRESLRNLERGEEAGEEAAKLAFYRRGRELAEQALAIDERDANAHFARFANWGRLLQSEGWLRNAARLPELWRELDRALEIDPKHSPSLGAKGGLYLKLPWFLGGSVEKAEPLLRRAVDVDPYTVGSRLELAECYLRTGRPEAARGLAAEALELARSEEKPRYVTRAQELLREIEGSDRTAKLPRP